MKNQEVVIKDHVATQRTLQDVGTSFGGMQMQTDHDTSLRVQLVLVALR